MSVVRSEIINLENIGDLESLVRNELNETIKFLNETKHFLNDIDQKSMWEQMVEINNNLMNIRQMKKIIADSLQDTELFFNDSENQDESVQEVYKTFEEKYQEMIAYNDEYYTETIDLIPGTLSNVIQSEELPRSKSKSKRRKAKNDSVLMNNDDNTFVVPTDPISKKPIEVPLRNTICGHVYDNDSIRHYLNTQPRRVIQCPVGGCSNENEFGSECLKLDQLLYKKIIEYNATINANVNEENNEE